MRHCRLRANAARGESGFTLAEMLVAIAIEGVIFGALATAFLVMLNGGSSVHKSLDRSSDARFAANYIVSDARNSSGPEISLTDTTSCTDPTPPIAGTPTAVARFNWNSPNADGTTTANISSYVVVSGVLFRRHCEAGVLRSDLTLANNIDTVTVTCAPIADCGGAPDVITVAIVETPDAVGAEPFTYSLTATFRKLIGGGSALAPSPPQSLVIFGKGGCGVSITGDASMKVFGDAFINTADNGSCNALTLDNSGRFSAGSTSILTGGTCVAGGGSVCPPVIPYSPAITDPFGGLEPPSLAGRPAQTGCTGPQASQTAQPGVYADTFSIQGGNTCTLASGIYILKNGFGLGNGAIVSTAPGGVLIYITGGAFTVGGGASLTVTAMTTGTWAGISVWQAAADTSTISFSNGGALVFNGAIYAPKAQLNITGNAQTPIAWSVAVQTVVLSNSGAISIGASPVPLSISGPATLPAWTVSRPYPSTTITPAGGDGSYTWSATGLPNGLSINATTGVVSGLPTAAGSASVVVTLNDALGDDPATQAYTLVVNAVPRISTTTLASGERTVPYTAPLAGAAGTPPYTWSATGVPAGLSINAGTGTISGTPSGSAGTASVAVTLTDASGATGATTLSLVIVGQPTIVSVALTNGPKTSGSIDAGDKVTIVYSAQMSVQSFCAAWSGDTVNQTLKALGDVTVTVTSGATDTLTVTSTACPSFNIGSIDLASGAYASVTATFNGSTTGTRSTVAWTASTHTLVITLGAKTAGTVANVSAQLSPIYTAAGTIEDSAGAVLGNSPFTQTPAAKRF